MIIKYKTCIDSLHICKFKIKRESKKYVWFTNGRRCLKESTKCSYYDSFEAARAAHIEACDIRIAQYTDRKIFFQKLEENNYGE